jgi:hypothetical protein
MNPLILIGLDLTVSTVLIVLAMFVVWSRVRSHLEMQGNDRFDLASATGTQSNREDMDPASGQSPREWEFGDITEKATSLKRKGHSMEEIAQRLQLPTREIEMVLAISEMAVPEPSGRAGAGSFPLQPEAARMG